MRVNILDRLKQVEARSVNFRNLYEECYQFGIPSRENFHETDGDDRMQDIYDSTAPDSVDNFANTAQSTMTPAEQQGIKSLRNCAIRPIKSFQSPLNVSSNSLISRTSTRKSTVRIRIFVLVPAYCSVSGYKTK